MSEQQQTQAADIDRVVDTINFTCVFGQPPEGALVYFDSTSFEDDNVCMVVKSSEPAAKLVSRGTFPCVGYINCPKSALLMDQVLEVGAKARVIVERFQGRFVFQHVSEFTS